MYKKILLPLDGSKNAERAGKHALWIADASDADIIVLTVFELYFPRKTFLTVSTLPGSNKSLYDSLMEEGNGFAEDFREKVEASKRDGKCKNVNLTTLIREGRPHEEILRTIKDEGIDLVVMGASGRHGLDKLTIGSVTERVVRESTSPVTVIP